MFVCLSVCLYRRISLSAERGFKPLGTNMIYSPNIPSLPGTERKVQFLRIERVRKEGKQISLRAIFQKEKINLSLKRDFDSSLLLTKDLKG